MSLFDKKLSELHDLLQKKEISVSDLVDESFQRIQQVEQDVQAFITLDEERAREKAKALDEKLEQTGRRAFCSGCRSA